MQMSSSRLRLTGLPTQFRCLHGVVVYIEQFGAVVRVVGVENTVYCCLLMSGLHVVYKFIGWKPTKTHHHHHHHQHEFSVGWWAVHPMATRRRMEERQRGNSDFCSFSLWWLHWTVRIDSKSSQQHLPMRSAQRLCCQIPFTVYSPKSYNSLNISK